MQLGLDVSNYSGEFNIDAVRCWRSQGYEHLVCGTQRREITRQQMAVAVEAGLTLDAYVYLYWSRDTAWEVGEALETIAGFPVQRLWLDCEDAANGREPGEPLAGLATRYLALAQGVLGALDDLIGQGEGFGPALQENQRAAQQP